MFAIGTKRTSQNARTRRRHDRKYNFDDGTDSSWRRTLDRWKVRAYVRQRSASSGHSASFDQRLFISQC